MEIYIFPCQQLIFQGTLCQQNSPVDAFIIFLGFISAIAHMYTLIPSSSLILATLFFTLIFDKVFGSDIRSASISFDTFTFTLSNFTFCYIITKWSFCYVWILDQPICCADPKTSWALPYNINSMFRNCSNSKIIYLYFIKIL